MWLLEAHLHGAVAAEHVFVFPENGVRHVRPVKGPNRISDLKRGGLPVSESRKEPVERLRKAGRARVRDELSVFSVPAALNSAHSKPSGFEEANQLNTPPVTSAAARNPTVNFRMEKFPSGAGVFADAINSGRAFQTKSTIAVVARPSTMPIAR